ncbi:hypothetical protein CYMTET_40292 [Cymbomonas tetramitiformis]|uniref:Integrase zinc-binding domain-containing protein n=1 Tax=Cymbomonas tetramitiformis TaxID=36881 RepID=A0AAE0C8C5_9CHLO|nr:hypothetical protein CYMTET_40292 [Cymbomonas tetramitiformis]
MEAIIPDGWYETSGGPLQQLRDEVLAAPHHATRDFRVLVGGVLWRVAAGRYQLVLGEDSPLREVIFKEAHDSVAAGHTGREKTLERVLRRFWWKNASEDVAEWMTSCPTCQAFSTETAARIYFDVVWRQHGGAYANRVVEDMLRSFVGTNPEDWDLYMTNVQFAINDSRSDVTGFTPFER